MRVLHVSKAYPPVFGGIETVLRDMAEGLAARGVEVTVLVCNRGRRERLEEGTNPRIIRVPSPWKVSSMDIGPSLVKEMRRIPRDITHIHIPYPLGVLAALLAPGDSKLVATWHSDIVRQKALLRFYAPILRRFLRRADAVYPTSVQYLACSRFLPTVRDKCHPIPLGVPPTSFLPSPFLRQRIEQIRAEMDPFVLFIGRLVGYKDPLCLIEAMGRLRDRAGSAGIRAVLLGGGPLDGPIRHRVAELGLTGRVTLLQDASDEEKIAHLHAARALVLPSVSHNEAYGVVLVEAMMCGLPLITTDLPTGVTFLNRHGENGLVFPIGDAPALAQAIQKVVSDPEEAHRMGQAGKDRAERELTADLMVDRQMEAYRRLLEDGDR